MALEIGVTLANCAKVGAEWPGGKFWLCPGFRALKPGQGSGTTAAIDRVRSSQAASEERVMKPKQIFKSSSLSDRHANYQLAWTLSWSFLMLGLLIVSVFRP
jgi:hypothetical protein